MKRLSFASLLPLFITAGLVFQAAWYGLLWSRMFTNPVDSRPSDFRIFYSAGRIAAQGQWSKVYDLQAQLAVQQELVGVRLQQNDLLPFNHPPLLVPILALVCTQNYMTSYWAWVLVMLVFTAAALALIDRLLKAQGWVWRDRWLLLLSSLFFYPIFVGLLKGQDTAFLLFGGMLWFYGLMTDKDAAAGLGLALMVIRPQIVLALALPFLFKRRRVFWWFCGGSALLAIFSLVLVGPQGVRDFFALLQISAAGQGFGMNQQDMFNFTGMVLRLFPSLGLNGVHIAAWALFLAAIIGLCVLWKISPEIGYRQVSLAVVLSLFAAPHLHYHDLILLMVSALALVMILVDKGRMRRCTAAGLLVMVSVVWMLGEIWNPARFTYPYLLMATLPALAWFYETD